MAEYYKYQHQGLHVRIYPLVCMHVGSPQCDMKFITEHIDRIATDPHALWVYMGDGGECVTKLSKGDVYGQLLSPTQQMDLLVDLLEPIKEQGILGIRGNHGKRIYKESGLDFDHNLMRILGLPYLGISTFLNIMMKHKTYKDSFDLFFHHGVDSGVALRTKIAKAEQFNNFVSADAIFTAHSHVAMELQPSALLSADNTNAKVHTQLRRQYICGSAYDSRSGYAEDFGYAPLLPSYIAVDFTVLPTAGHTKIQEFTKWHSEGDYELKHDYIQGYKERDKIHG